MLTVAEREMRLGCWLVLVAMLVGQPAAGQGSRQYHTVSGEVITEIARVIGYSGAGYAVTYEGDGRYRVAFETAFSTGPIVELSLVYGLAEVMEQSSRHSTVQNVDIDGDQKRDGTRFSFTAFGIVTR